jgi:ElaB/YqjD/DUF883 family membrane-anchored ribosome-binding protein
VNGTKETALANKRESGQGVSDQPLRSGRRGGQKDEDRAARVRAAKEKVRIAREALRRAKEDYSKMLDQGSDPLEQLRGVSLGEIVEDVLEWVREHPGAGVAAAAAAGFFLGGLLRRIR